MGKEIGPRAEPFAKPPLDAPSQKKNPLLLSPTSLPSMKPGTDVILAPKLKRCWASQQTNGQGIPVSSSSSFIQMIERVLAEFFQSRDTGKPFCSEYRLLARDGHIVWVRDEAIVMRDEAGRPCFMQGLLLNISEQKRKEEMLQKSESKFRTFSKRSLLALRS